MAFKHKSVAVLIPAYNEATQIESVVKSLPAYVDRVIIVNDASTDSTADVVHALAETDQRVVAIDLEKNRGVGGAMAVAYQWARDHGIDIAVRTDGDGQMDPEEMEFLIDPIAQGTADYTKGNRLWDPADWKRIPRVRLFGNAVLSLLTKIASGYWSVVDSQSGYSAAGRFALDRIQWDQMYGRYGQPNDLLVLANVAECRVADIPVTPIYGVGERSYMRIAKVIFTISALLFRRFWWRLWRKYLLRDFHPLLFFYLLATVTSIIAAGLVVRLLYFWFSNGYVPQVTALALSFFVITTLNSLFFAFWMDMQVNAPLMVSVPFESTSRRSSIGDEVA